ncbi:hypothetical protein TNCV_431181 [Trichonephila clavipes]|nr:hypothetical protein TNCV_431181 [Trichonephila clavipes]
MFLGLWSLEVEIVSSLNSLQALEFRQQRAEKKLKYISHILHKEQITVLSKWGTEADSTASNFPKKVEITLKDKYYQRFLSSSIPVKCLRFDCKRNFAICNRCKKLALNFLTTADEILVFIGILLLIG